MTRRTRWSLPCLALVLASALAARDASANMYLFTGPGSNDFGPTDDSLSVNYTLNGLKNMNTYADVFTASLGYNTGGTNSFGFGFNAAPGFVGTAGTATCTVYVNGVGASAGANYAFSNSGTLSFTATITGPEGFSVATNVPSGTYFYSVECSVPPNGTVYFTGSSDDRPLVPKAAGGLLNGFAADNPGTGYVPVTPAVPYFQSGVVTAVASPPSGAFTVGGTFITSLGGGASSTGPGFALYGYSPTGGGLSLGCSVNDGSGALQLSGVGQGPINAYGQAVHSGPFQAQCADIVPYAEIFGIVPYPNGGANPQALLVPVSGAGFSALQSAIPPLSPVIHGQGWVRSTSAQTVYASLGYSGGGPLMFGFAGTTFINGSVACTVYAVNDSSGVSYAYTNQFSPGTWSSNYNLFVTSNLPSGSNTHYFYSAACTLNNAELGGAYPSKTIYDPAPGTNNPATQCTVSNGSTSDTMHCCPSGYAMVGAHIGQNVFKCGRIVSPNGPAKLDTGTQRYSMHACPYGSVMVGLDVGANRLACQPTVTNTVVGEWLDTGSQDLYPMHVCNPSDTSAGMSGIDVGGNRLLCADYPIFTP